MGTIEQLRQVLCHLVEAESLANSAALPEVANLIRIAVEGTCEVMDERLAERDAVSRTRALPPTIPFRPALEATA